MTAYIRQLLTDLERLDYVVLGYHRGILYIDHVGFRDVPWAVRQVRLHIPARVR